MLSAQKHLAAVSVEALFPFVILARGGWKSERYTPRVCVHLGLLEGEGQPLTKPKSHGPRWKQEFPDSSNLATTLSFRWCCIQSQLTKFDRKKSLGACR